MIISVEEERQPQDLRVARKPSRCFDTLKLSKRLFWNGCIQMKDNAIMTVPPLKKCHHIRDFKGKAARIHDNGISGTRFGGSVYKTVASKLDLFIALRRWLPVEYSTSPVVVRKIILRICTHWKPAKNEITELRYVPIDSLPTGLYTSYAASSDQIRLCYVKGRIEKSSYHQWSECFRVIHMNISRIIHYLVKVSWQK